jgi:HlyD family secretion protein
LDQRIPESRESPEVAAEVMGTGTLEARVKTTISPRIQERLAEVLVDQGDAVSAGQLLARLDDGELKRRSKWPKPRSPAPRPPPTACAWMKPRAQAVERRRSKITSAFPTLLATKVSSQPRWTRPSSSCTSLNPTCNAPAPPRWKPAAGQHGGKNLGYQQERLGFTRILSPYDGLVTRRDRDPGGVVVPGSSILQLISTNELWVSAWVDETAAAALRTGQPARVVFRSEPAPKSYPGKSPGSVAKPIARRGSFWWTCA